MSDWEPGQLHPLAMSTPMFSFMKKASRIHSGPPPRQMLTLYALPSFGFTSVQEFLAAEEATAAGSHEIPGQGWSEGWGGWSGAAPLAWAPIDETAIGESVQGTTIEEDAQQGQQQSR